MPTVVRMLIVIGSAIVGAGFAPASSTPPTTDAPTAQAAAEAAAFDSDRWLRPDATLADHMGQRALAGLAYLPDVQFDDGVIEVDIAVTGARSYPGILFRMQSPQDYERVYIRPHRPGTLYPDTLQYVPAFHGIDSWQLYNGEGYTAGATVPVNEWLHVRLEVAGTQARVFLGDGAEPALRIDHLQHGTSRGMIGLSGPKDGSAWFANFRYRSDHSLAFQPPPRVDPSPGMLDTWQISTPFKAQRLDPHRPPREQQLPELAWKTVQGSVTGLVDVAREFGRTTREPECVLARATLHVERDELRRYRFGYSDEVTIFLNDQAVFTGNSAYRSRDPSFLGIVGLFDSVYLPLKAGDNELLLVVSESFGGWGFMVQDATAVFAVPGVKRRWESAARFETPESVAFDPVRSVFYVSNYDAYNPSNNAGQQSISRLSLDGQTCDAQWVTGLNNPSGLAVQGDTLWAVERGALVAIDIPTGKIARRSMFPGGVGLNDVAVGPDGVVYVSDSRRGTIFRLAGETSEEWLHSAQVDRPNGLLVYKGRLIFANNGDGCVKAVDLKTKEVSVVARLDNGLIDGLAEGNDGSILASHNEGRLFRIAPSGEITRLLDTTTIEMNLADFVFVPEQRLIVAPTWVDNRVVAYELPE